MSKQREVLILVNPVSGVHDKKSIVKEVVENLEDHINFDLRYTEYADHATILAKESVDNKLDAVVVIGGDGTINEVGKALVGSKTALAVIPCGSGNGFARHLKIPLETKAATEKINRFKKSKIDVGSANDQIFLSTLGVGFDAHVAHKFADFGKRGFLSYMQVSTNEFVGYNSEKYKIKIDGKVIEKEAFLIVVANASQYGNNAWIAPSASTRDGKLNVGILSKFPAAYIPDILLKLFNKKIEHSKYYEKLVVEELELLYNGIYHIDGEPLETKDNLKIKVLNKALRVIR